MQLLLLPRLIPWVINGMKATVVFNNIKLPINASVKEAFSVARRRLCKLVSCDDASFAVYKRSIDARHKDNIQFVYSISASLDAEVLTKITPEKLKLADATMVDREFPQPKTGAQELSSPPVVVGTGPCGLFCALLLAEWGYNPIVLERGGTVEERRRAIDRFNTFHILDKDTNIQFGAGGAGTFSDGKLVTRVNDPLTSYVIERFIEFGAPENIRYVAKPHVGTDILSIIVDKMLDRIVELGGRIEYHTKFISPKVSSGRITHIVTNRGELEAGALILAIGHSARDTYESLMKLGVSIEAKSFSVGMRIEHLAYDIDRAMYGDFAGHDALGHAEYTLSHNTKERGVYTFCMCPGGEVVAAASEEGGVVVNGMSYHSRSGINSNSAIACTVFREDYGSTPTAAINFQRKIEKEAFAAGGGDYSAPIITVGDFLEGKCKTEPTTIKPTYMFSSSVRLAAPERYLPKFITESIKNAITAFDKRISGFASPNAVLTGAETRTSAPVRILRDPQTRLATGYDNFYPAGEGAGYAGGITSAAVDGIRTAISLIETYKPLLHR